MSALIRCSHRYLIITAILLATLFTVQAAAVQAQASGTGSLTVVLTTTSDVYGIFIATSGTSSDLDFDLLVNTDENPTGEDRVTLNNLQPGTYDFSFFFLDNTYEVVGISCSAVSSSTDSTLSVTVGANTDVTCTISAALTPPQVTIRKRTIPHGTEETFALTSSIDNFTSKQILTDRSEITLFPPEDGMYRFVETDLPQDWTLLAVRCTIPGIESPVPVEVIDSIDPPGRAFEIFVGFGVQRTCTLYNEQANVEPLDDTGSLTIVLTTTSDIFTIFNATTDIPDNSDFDLFLNSDENPTGEARITLSDLAPNQYNLAFSFFVGIYDVANISCTSNSSSSNNQLSVSVGAGQDVVCTIDAEPVPPQVTFRKRTNPRGAAETFSLMSSIDGFASKQRIRDGSEILFTAKENGIYTFVETDLPENWTLLSVKCFNPEVDSPFFPKVTDSSDPAGRTFELSLGFGGPLDCTLPNEEANTATSHYTVYLPLIFTQ